MEGREARPRRVPPPPPPGQDTPLAPTPTLLLHPAPARARAPDELNIPGFGDEEYYKLYGQPEQYQKYR